MLDLYHVPNVGEIGNVQQDVYYGTVGTITTNITRVPWFKPRGKSMCSIFMLGAGGGGGPGFIGVASAAGGGGGGGSGAQTVLSLPLWALPDVMLIEAGTASAGGITSNPAASQPSRILNASALGLIAIANGGGGGAIGTAVAGGGNGGAGATAVIATAPAAMLHGLMTTNINLAGAGGNIGGFNAAGGAISYPTTGLCVSGGAGGGSIGTTGNGFAGGAVGASTFWDAPAITGGVASAGVGGNGNAGVRWPFGNDRRMTNSGGSGGAGSAFNSATSGGNGGNGGWGCGGAGGGAVLTGGVAGRGGNGGPGLVIITCW